MKRSARCNACRWVLAAALLLGAGAVRAQQEQKAQVAVRTITDFRVPEFDENGHKKSELFGATADMMQDGRVKIKGLRIVMYDKDGVTVLGTVVAADCIFDKKDKSAFSNTAVSLQRNIMVVTGRGMRWNSDSQHIEILNDVRVELKGVKMWNQLEKP